MKLFCNSISVLIWLTLFLEGCSKPGAEQDNPGVPKNLAASQGQVTMGITSVLSDGDNGNGSLLVAQQVGLSETATLQTLSFYVTGIGGQLVLGVYDATGPNSGPGRLLAQTQSFSPTVGWNTQNVISPVVLSPGNYFLTYLPSSDALSFVKGTGGNSFYGNYPFGNMPGSFLSNPNTTTSQWSFYATLSILSSPTPAPTPIPSPLPVAVALVQNSAATSNSASVSLTFGSQNKTGDLILVTAMWVGTSSVSAISDSLGNAYSHGTPQTLSPGNNSVQIFYAKNIKEGANRVSLTTVSSSNVMIYVQEYSGLDQVNPIDAIVSASGTGPSANSGAATTHSANEIIYGGILSDATVKSAGGGFTSLSILNGNLSEYKKSGPAGSYTVTATNDSSGWAAQLVGLKPAVQDRTTLIQATASGPIGIVKVEFYVNNQLICTTSTTPYDCSWAVPPGTGIVYHLQTKAYDAQGKVGLSQVVNVTAK